MPTNEDSSPGIRGAGATQSDPAADDATIIRLGLAISVFGGQLAEAGRLRRKLTRAQRGDATGRLVAILDGITGDLDTLKIGLRAMARRDHG